jgi:hypothetical protein
VWVNGGVDLAALAWLTGAMALFGLAWRALYLLEPESQESA